MLLVALLQQTRQWLITGLGRLVLIGLSLQSICPGAGESRESLGGQEISNVLVDRKIPS